MRFSLGTIYDVIVTRHDHRSAAEGTCDKPFNLDAPGLSRLDFDRLSVAYGLSFLDVGKVVKAMPYPQPRSITSDTWRDNYIEK